MNKYNSKPVQLLSLIDRPDFIRTVMSAWSDKFYKEFSTWQQLAAMVVAQVTDQTPEH